MSVRMYTNCPGCRMNLAVTANDLRVGQGYVRCGRCERVFNALLSLSEEVDAEEELVAKATGTTTVPAIDEEETFSPEDILLEEPGGEFTGDDSIEVQQLEDFEIEIVAPVEDHPADEASSGTEGFAAVEYFSPTVRNVPLTTSPAGADDDGDAMAPSDLAETEASGEATADPVPEIDADAAVGNRPRAHWAWYAIACVLGLLLAGQMVHHNRQKLVAKAWLERPLGAVYHLFGVVLEPAWNLKAYDLRQLGGEAMGASTTIVLRASVQNTAPNPQPPPMIRAVLQDRYGNAIATMAIAPQDYARGGAPSRLAPDQRLDAELHLDDPSRQAVGFELDACLPGADGALHCSADP